MMETSHLIKRRKSRQIMVGNVAVGGDAPVAVQSMTNTETTDVAATVGQIQRLQQVGADLVRVSVPTMDAAEAFGEIKKQTSIPLIADIHFDYKIALRVAELGVDCLRINPGNIGREDRVRAVEIKPVTLIFRSVLVSMPALWKKNCKKNMVSRRRMRWWNQPCGILIFWIG